MNSSTVMKASALNAMVHVMGLEKKDSVLVVIDEESRDVGGAFAGAAESLGCATETHVISGEGRPLKEVPPGMAAALEGKTVVINAFRSFPDETPFRVKWIKLITDPKTMRLGHGPGITEAMMSEGPMNVDFRKMAAMADTMIESFENARSVHITAPGGTDLTVGIEDRVFSTDTRITVDQAGNLPCGEIWCAPVETGADGLLVIDGCIGDVDITDEPLRIEIARGKITSLESDNPKLIEEVVRLTSVDDEAKVIGELGIGLNPGAKITGNMLEDEKAFRTAHIAFGCNDDMPGGRNHSKTHRDFLFHRPTFDVEFKDGTRRVPIKDGDFQV